MIAALEMFKARWAALTQRERAAILVLSAAAAAALATWAADTSSQASDAEARARLHRRAVEAAYTQASDPAARDRLGEQANKVWRWSLVDANESAAELQLVALIESSAAESGLQGPVVSPSALPAGVGGAVSARLQADFTWPSFMEFLKALEVSQTSVAIEDIEVSSGAEGAQTVSLVVTAQFLPEAQP